MSKFDFDIDLEAGVKVISGALDEFLRDKHLKLTHQKYDRLKKLLMVKYSDGVPLFETVYQYLEEIVEYRKDYEININAKDEAEEDIMQIISTADFYEVEIPVETTRFKKRFFAVLALSGLLIVGILTYQVTHFIEKDRAEAVEMAKVVTTDEEAELRSLVYRVVDFERSNGRTMTPNAIYNRLKLLDAVRDQGEVSSYKKFTYGQFLVAKQYLEAWENSAEYPAR